MRIRKLDLHGFKSFPDRTTLQFGAGVSCIVGPNGCGKSNIMDALRWCIGEQSARSLRGSEMMDVIFAGSADRKAVGFAEVTLTLTSEDGEPFPGEYAHYDEISVGRRLHRTGASEYVINQQRVRRRDVLDLFLDTGVANNLYSFIEQGRIGKIVHAKPSERRSLIDEAAGISRYKARREEAQARLEATATQLDRAADVADEMAKRVRTLSRQVLKAARFRRLRSLVRQDEIALSLAKYAALSEDRRALRGRLRTANGELASAQRERSRRETDLASRHEEVDVVQAAVDTLRDAVSELDGRRREVDSQLAFLAKRVVELTGRIEAERQAAERARSEALNAEVELETARGDSEESELKVSEAVSELERLQIELAEATEALSELRAKGMAAQRSVNLAQQQADGIVHQRSEAERHLAAVPQAIEQATALRERHLEELATAEAEVQAAVAEVGRATEARDAGRAELRGLDARLAEAKQRSALAHAKAGEEEQRFDTLTEELEAELGEMREQLEVLEHGAEHVRRSSGRTVRERVEIAGKKAREDVIAAQRTRQSELGLARDRSGRWLQAIADADESALRAFEGDSARLQQDLATGQAQRARAAREAHRAALEAKLSAIDAHLGQELRESEAVLQGARQRVATRQQAQRDVTGALAAATTELAIARTSLQQLVAELAARQASDVGAIAVRAALPGAQTLLEVLDDDSRALDWVGDALGDRIGLPVVHADSDVLRAAEAAHRSGRTQVLLRGAGRLTIDEALGGVAVVDSLAEALEHARTRGGAAVVRRTGERIDWDGRVTIGPVADSGPSVIELDRLREQAERQVEVHEAVLVDIEARNRRIHEELDLAVVHLDDAIAQADRTRAELVEAKSQTRTLAESEAAALQQDLDAETHRERDALRLTRQALAERMAHSTKARSANARAQRDDALRILERQHSRSVDDARQGVHTAEESARSEAQEEAELELVQAATAVDQAREQVRASREVTSARREAARADLAAARAHDKKCRDDLDVHRADVASAADRVAKADVALVQARSEELQARSVLQGIGDRITTVRDQIAALEAQAVDGRRLVQELSVRSEHAQAHLEEVLRIHARSDAASAQASTIVDEARAAMAQIQVDAATWRERTRALGDAIQTAQRLRSEASDRQERALEQIRQLVEDREHAVAEMQAGKVELESTAEQRAARWDELERRRARHTVLRQGVREADASLRALVDRVAELTAAVEQLGAEVAQTKTQVEGLRGRISERYQLSLPGLLDCLDVAGHLLLEADESVREDVIVDGTTVEAVPPVRLSRASLFDEDLIQSRIERLGEHRKRLERIGEVNLAAVEEYEEIASRHAELEEQRADLESSIARIRSAIAKMNRTCRQRFRDTFDRVNDHFQVMYPRLVGGGSARLSLTDEDDLLETGVDIFVQPPGKRLQNLSLLSGGEKAMTAIALILSLFKVKPSPFCVLDEVDAPLDEANGSRFNQALVEMSEVSQFIVVTHNRKTMECATTLYGITMPTPGVSRLVSVRVGG